jgi:2,4-dienoyl-CoA reductase-like NADH-dependent reductase (Old Yellow Enzyme family)
MSQLFSPFKIKDVTIRNRLVMSPMCQYSAVEGFANDWHLVHYGSRATGGIGLVIQEATAVSPEGRITPGDLGLYQDAHIEYLKKITSAVKEQGAVAGIQLAHAGRKAGCTRPWEGGKQLSREEGGWLTFGPSPMTFNDEDRLPAEMNPSDIGKVISDFRDAVCRALDAGFQLVEIHAAHGYLLHEFLSPISNQRTDQYGGSFENRIRLLLQVVDAVKSEWPESLPLFVRISATDWIEGGWNIEEAVALCKVLKSEGVDLIDTSSGGMVPYAQIPFSPGYQVEFSEKIRRQSGIATGTVGLITEARQAEAILKEEKADLILLGRALLREPYFALNAARILGADIKWPNQYLRGRI